VVVTHNSMEKILDPVVAYQGIFPFDESRAKGMSDDQIADRSVSIQTCGLRPR
jgi:hypothetical protein